MAEKSRRVKRARLGGGGRQRTVVGDGLWDGLLVDEKMELAESIKVEG